MDISNIDLTPQGIDRSQRPIKDSLASVPGGRHYAIGVGALEPASIWLAIGEHNGSSPSTLEVGKFLKERVAPFNPGLFQLRTATEPKPPALPQINGIQIANPFSHDDRQSQNAFIARDPEAAAFWKEAAQRGGGSPTYAQLLEYEKRLAESRAVSAIEYGATAHKQNVFLTDDRSAQNNLLRTDPQRAAIHKWEAEHSPLRFVWSATHGNQTAINRALAGDEEVGKILLRARDIHRDLLARQRDEAQKAISAAQALLKVNAAPARRVVGALR
jgi:hypothetical protein